MNKLTLPIEAGKKYIRRDGKIAIPTESRHDDMLLIDGVTHIFSKTGGSGTSPYTQYNHDLVEDYIEDTAPVPVTGHIHAASMLLYAQDAAETDTPWSRWEYMDTSYPELFMVCIANPKWFTNMKYRRKTVAPVFININGHQVPAPMRVAPEIDSIYWAVNIGGLVSLESTWNGFGVDRTRLRGGICHTTMEAAELHADALISFTRS